MDQEMTKPSANGEVQINGETGTLLFRRHLAHPPEDVWSALTDPEQLRQWYMTRAKIDGRPGGSVDMVSGPAPFHWTGEILAWEPPRLLEYTWNIDPREELPHGEKTVVRYELQASEGGTLLTLTHRNLTRGTALGFAPGTHTFLDRLEAMLDKSPMPDWVRRYGEVKGAYPAWTRPS